MDKTLPIAKQNPAKRYLELAIELAGEISDRILVFVNDSVRKRYNIEARAFNIGPAAVRNLTIDSDRLSFNCRMQGQERHISLEIEEIHLVIADGYQGYVQFPVHCVDFGIADQAGHDYCFSNKEGGAETEKPTDNKPDAPEGTEKVVSLADRRKNK